mmetsp:Transcript_40710/g.161372  ORF Transcript_40710/g.161372 Transcript_40710/m.161372 type:complete len:81 (+) Transcript_40710:767-1009(+)
MWSLDLSSRNGVENMLPYLVFTTSTGVIITAATLPEKLARARFSSLFGVLPWKRAKRRLNWAWNRKERAFHGTSREIVAV